VRSVHKYECQVAAIITAMTELEKPFLRDAIAAVLSELYIGQVILCIEEGNNWIDASLRDFLADPRLTVIRIPLAPAGAVRNRALTYVRLPWIAYYDGDDIWCKGKILTQCHYANETGCDLVGADHYLTNENGRIRAVSLIHQIPMPSTWMVRTEVMRQHLFNETYLTGSDGEWWIRTEGSVKKVRCPKLLLLYRVRSGSVSAQSPSMKRKKKIVSLANIPGFGAIIFFLTWCLWLATRQSTYAWNPEWDQ
jgi:Glycosyl transferase family 2